MLCGRGGRKFTFLCVKVLPPKEQESVGKHGKLPPLHLSFKSSTTYYPLRFSSRQGVFDVNLYVLTKRKLDYEANGDPLQRLRWSNKEFKRNVALRPEAMPKTLADVFKNSRFKDDTGSWYFNNIRGKDVNKGNAIAKWDKDIFFRTGVASGPSQSDDRRLASR